jgi:hypothetical protein
VREGIRESKTPLLLYVVNELWSLVRRPAEADAYPRELDSLCT